MNILFVLGTHRGLLFGPIGLFIGFVVIPAIAIWFDGWERRRAAERQRERAERHGGKR